MMGQADLIILVLLAVVSGIAVYGLSGRAAAKLWLTDKVKARSNHRQPASRAGGLVITLVILVATGVAILLGWPLPPTLAVIALVAAGIGLLDDISDIPARMKMAAFVVLCGFASIYTGPLGHIPLPFGPGISLPEPAGYVLAALFLFGFLNAFNFMDGLNGMAAGGGMIGLSVLLVLFAPSNGGIVILYVITAAALYGFAVRNLLKGGIFLGDAGSLGVAMLLGAGALHAGQARPEAVYVFAIAFIPFLLDVAYTFCRRAMRGARVFDAHKEHIYQRLRAEGWSHQAVSAAYALLILNGGIAAITLPERYGSFGLWTAGVLTTALCVFVWRGMFGLRARPDGQPNSAQDPQASA
ncbi:glycosyltransferase family 4 protein [Parvularcula marina]|uniref:Undecaprenyl/decaprenyl-phosphate alpha-N-acetylglucosaminyl 1-phosphate transferase n=1 Tax=Parvularcula marina TaxID=2292771 RepID=A0A371RFW6_9PROT|nr:hypothetical protein [Parvularcula marina]RFB04325.1 hypothetical protein DX908_02920 [Parvularcula marina]